MTFSFFCVTGCVHLCLYVFELVVFCFFIEELYILKMIYHGYCVPFACIMYVLCVLLMYLDQLEKGQRLNTRTVFQQKQLNITTENKAHNIYNQVYRVQLMYFISILYFVSA